MTFKNVRLALRKKHYETKVKLLRFALTQKGPYVLLAVMFSVWLVLTFVLCGLGRYSVFADLNRGWSFALFSVFSALGCMGTVLYALIFRVDGWHVMAKKVMLYMLASMVLCFVTFAALHLYIGISPLNVNPLGLLWLNPSTSDGHVVMVSVLFVQLLGLGGLYYVRHPKQLGGAHFQTLSEARKNKLTAQAGPVFLLGLLEGTWIGVRKVMVTVVCDTGAGKTAGLIVPNMLHDSGSMIVNDNSGELYALLSDVLRKKGYKVLQWSPFNTDSDGWNPLLTIRWTADCLNEDLDSIVNTLVPSAVNQDGNEGSSKFFNANTRDIIKALIIYQYCQYGLDAKELSIEAVMNTILLNELDDLFNDILSASKKKARYIYNIAKMCVSKLEDVEGETKQNILLSAQTHLASLYSPRVLKTLSQQSIDLLSIRHEKTVVFITVPADEIVNERMRPFLTLFYRKFMDGMIEDGLFDSDKHQIVTCYLDEFGNMGRVNTLVNSTTDKRKYGCRFMFILQYRAQVEQIYGNKMATAILDGSTRLMGASGVSNDCQIMSQALGKKNRKKKVGKGKGTYMEIVKEPLLDVDELGRLPDTDWVVAITGQQPLRLRKGFYFEDMKMLEGLPRVKKQPL